MKFLTSGLMAFAIVLLAISTANSHYYGESLKETEQRAVANTLQYALEYNKSGDAATWNNPDSQQSGSTVPLKTFQTAAGVYCREFQQTIIIGDKEEQGYGTACRQPDGSWRIVNPRLREEVARETSRETVVYYPDSYRYYDPWRFGYPYSYRYFPRHISFSFGFIHHDGYYFSGHRNFRSHKSYYRSHRLHVPKHRPLYRDRHKHDYKPRSKRHLGKRSHISHQRWPAQITKTEPKRVNSKFLRGNAAHRGKQHFKQNNHRSTHSGQPSLLRNKARTDYKNEYRSRYQRGQKFMGKKVVRHKQSGGKGFRGKGFRDL